MSAPATTTTTTTTPTSTQRPAGGGRLRPGQAAIIAGVLLLVIGGVLITVGWDQAAELDYVQGQFPYLLSASIPGIALIIIGMSVLVLAMVRRDAREREEQLEKLNTTIVELSRRLGPKDPYDPAVTGEYRPRPRTATNGVDGDAATIEIAQPGTFEQGK